MQPFINKIGGAIANGIVGLALILSGINAAETPEDVTDSGLLMMKVAMLILPLIFIVIGYLIYKRKFKIDKVMFDEILADLAQRGDIKQD